MIYLRNRKTTEYKAVAEDSEEFYDLTTQRDADDRRPIWEQVTAATAADFKRRVEQNRLTDEDVGDAGQPTGDLTASGAAPGDTFGPDRSEPTPGEKAQGAGRAAEDAEEPEINGIKPGIPGIASEPVADGTPDPVEAQPPGQGQLSEDEQAAKEEASFTDLKDEVERRGLEVEGTGKQGAIKKVDLERAIEEAGPERSEEDEGEGDDS